MSKKWFTYENGTVKEYDSVDKFPENCVGFVYKITNMLSYTFIIPLIPLIYQMATDNLSDEFDLKQLAIRIISFTGLTLSGIIFRELLSKMVRRFKG